jgi:hypothetical protein
MTSAREEIAETHFDRTSTPLVLAWPDEGVPVAIKAFSKQADWRAFIAQWALPESVPQVVRQLYSRACQLYLLAWTDLDLIKAGEHLKPRQRTLDPLLRYMIKHDGLADEALRVSVRSGGSVIANFFGDAGLIAKRNSLAHGMAFDALPTAGLLEIVRDLIAYAYRYAPNELNII